MPTLKGDPLPWLLEEENPSIRYWALLDLLDRPATDPDVQAARAAIPRQPLVIELFARQHAAGHWGVDETRPYTAQGALAALSLLAMLGVPPDSRTRAGCESFLNFCQHTSGGFSMTQKLRSGIFPCTTGEHLPFLVYFGLANDPRVQAAFDFLIEDLSTPNPLECGRYQHQACLWGAISALNGLATLPAGLRTAQTQQGAALLAELLLATDYDFTGEHKRWLSFSVPHGWNLLSALRALSAHGYAGDPRFLRLLERFLECQDGQGRWHCGGVSHTWPLEKRNAPSKWVTLDALRLLKNSQSFPK